MKEKNKKIFAVLMLPVIFSNSFPFIKLEQRQQEESPFKKIAEPHIHYPDYQNEVKKGVRLVNATVFGFTSTTTIIINSVVNFIEKHRLTLENKDDSEKSEHKITKI